MKVLYIDDNLINRRVVEIGLKALGQIDTAEDGYSGIEKAKSGAYEVIMIDLNLNDPDIDGFNILNQLKITSKVPALYAAVTAYVGDGWENKCLDAGFDWYITKPIDLVELVQRIRKYSEAS